MPQIIVVADVNEAQPGMMFRERVTPIDFESEHSARQLLQRLEWAVADAYEAERHDRERDWSSVADLDYDAGWEQPDYLARSEESVLTTAS